MNHYTYLLQSQTSDMMYIGVRSSECLPEEDNNYWGSSKYLPEDVSETFDKFILGRFNTRDEAVADEIRRHEKNDVARNPLFINRARQTSTGFDTAGLKCNFSEEHIRNLRKACKGIKKSEEHKKNLSKSKLGRKYPKLGYKKTEEHKKKLSEAMKRQVVCPHCSKTGAIGIMKRWHFDNCKSKCDS